MKIKKPIVVFQKDRFYTLEEAAKTMGISRTNAFRMIKRGELPKAKHGRRYFWSGQLITDHLNKILKEDNERTFDS